MSDNKVKNKLDFRNLTTSQFDPGQTQKMAFSEYQSAYKYYATNAILKRPYSHFIQTLDGQGRPTRVEYYQATYPARDRINVRADVGGDLAGTYIQLQEYISKKTFVYYFVVSGSGTAPGIGDVEIPVNINTNDPTSLVAFALKVELKETEEFIVIGSQILSGYVDIEYLEFGETAAINVGTTGFLVTRINEGQSFLVGEVDLSYDSNGNPIYNGNTLTGFLFNPYTASFDYERSQVNVTVKEDGAPLLEYSEVNSLAQAATATILTYTVPVNKKVKLTRSNIFGTNMGTYVVKINDTVVDKLGTYYTKFNDKFEFDDLEYTAGTVITIEVLNRGMQSGDFNANLQGRIFDV